MGYRVYNTANDGTTLVERDHMGRCDTVVLDGSKMSRLAVVRGWMRTDLACAAGVSTTRLSSAFNGRPIGPRIAKRIADALGVTISDLITEAPANQKE